PDERAALVPIPLDPGTLSCKLVSGTPLIGTSPVFAPIMPEGASPQTWPPSTTGRGKPVQAVKIPAADHPPINLSNQLPVLNRWPFPAGNSHTKKALCRHFRP